MAGRPKTTDLFIVIDPEDKYEFPIFVGSIEEVAEYCHSTRNAIKSAISHAKRRGSKSKYVRVKV